jgi:hypothetical protein
MEGVAAGLRVCIASVAAPVRPTAASRPRHTRGSGRLTARAPPQVEREYYVQVHAQRPSAWSDSDDEAPAEQQQAGCARTERAPRSRQPRFTNSALLFGLPWLLPGDLLHGSELASLQVQLLARPEVQDAPGEAAGGIARSGEATGVRLVPAGNAGRATCCPGCPCCPCCCCCCRRDPGRPRGGPPGGRRAAGAGGRPGGQAAGGRGGAAGPGAAGRAAARRGGGHRVHGAQPGAQLLRRCWQQAAADGLVARSGPTPIQTAGNRWPPLPRSRRTR